MSLAQATQSKAAQFTVVLLGNADRLKHVGFQFLLGFASVQNKECHQKHSLVLALQFLQQGFCISAVGCQIRRNDVNIISGTDGFFLVE